MKADRDGSIVAQTRLWNWMIFINEAQHYSRRGAGFGGAADTPGEGGGHGSAENGPRHGENDGVLTLPTASARARTT